MTPSEFHSLAKAIAEINNTDLATAEDWLALIGDTPDYIDDTSDLVTVPDGSGLTIRWPSDL